MAGRFGMSDRLGPGPHAAGGAGGVPRAATTCSTKDVSQPTLEHLDAEVRRILDEQEARARAILFANMNVATAGVGAGRPRPSRATGSTATWTRSSPAVPPTAPLAARATDGAQG